jgi:hypothetical protein
LRTHNPVIIEANKKCPECGRLLRQKPGESNSNFRDRVTCGISTPCYSAYMKRVKEIRYGPYSRLGPDVPPRQLRPLPKDMWFHDDPRAKLDMGSLRREMPLERGFRPFTASSSQLAVDRAPRPEKGR